MGNTKSDLKENLDDFFPIFSPEEAEQRKKHREEVLQLHQHQMELQTNHCGFGWGGRTGEFPRLEDLSIYWKLHFEKRARDEELSKPIEPKNFKERRIERRWHKRRHGFNKAHEFVKLLKVAGFSQEVLEGKTAWSKTVFVSIFARTTTTLVILKGIAKPTEQQLYDEIGKAAWDKLKSCRTDRIDLDDPIRTFIESKHAFLQNQAEIEALSASASAHLFDDSE